MGFFDAIRRTLDKPSADGHAAPVAAASPPPAEPPPLVIPEIESAELIPLYNTGSGPRLVDCREIYEWQQVRIPGSVHIPMNEIPRRLAELDPGEEWVVVCAHGNRSFSVAGYLITNGYRASSLAGGVTDWWIRGGKTESDLRR